MGFKGKKKHRGSYGSGPELRGLSTVKSCCFTSCFLLAVICTITHSFVLLPLLHPALPLCLVAPDYFAFFPLYFLSLTLSSHSLPPLPRLSTMRLVCGVIPWQEGTTMRRVLLGHTTWLLSSTGAQLLPPPTSL